ncbi:MAG: hypothetical protein P1Q69_16385, partial [Candidatus Thorarchaeota archaeon]|nr:hypothetical protein [Candidatus Thorarchaeota archaeon]
AEDDRYPRSISDLVSPTISEPSDVMYELGSPTSIEWTPQDQYPGWYDIYVNGTFVKNGTWFASSIIYTPEFEIPGIYNITVVARDAARNEIMDTVIVAVVDSIVPIIDSPEDIQYVEGTGGHYLTWHPSDDNPQNWTLLVNGSVERTGLWDGGGITVSIDGLGAGVYNFTILVSDTSGNIVIDTVIVTVTPAAIVTTTLVTTPTTPPIQPPDIMTLIIILVGGIAIAVVVIVVVLRRGVKGYEP